MSPPRSASALRYQRVQGGSPVESRAHKFQVGMSSPYAREILHAIGRDVQPPFVGKKARAAKSYDMRSKARRAQDCNSYEKAKTEAEAEAGKQESAVLDITALSCSGSACICLDFSTNA